MINIKVIIPAYNEEYSCPIPPRENDLDIAIKAGVKAYGKH